MKRLSFFAALLVGLGMAGSGFAQSAAQYIAAGNQYYAAKDYVKGAQYYQAATQADPNSAAAFQGLGNCEYVQGHNSEALAAYEKALAINPNNAQLSTFVQGLRAKVGASAPAPAAATPAAASPAVVSPRSSSGGGKFELDVNAGVAFASGITGFGGGLGGYFPLSPSFSLGLMSGFYTFGQSASASYGSATATASASINFLEVMAAAKYRLDVPGFHPYFFGGVGIADESTSYSYSGSSGSTTVSGSGSGGSAIDPMIALGAGVEFPMGNSMNFFAQGKYSIVFVPGTTQTVSTGYGSTTVTSGGGTSTYLPLEIGLDFNL